MNIRNAREFIQRFLKIRTYQKLRTILQLQTNQITRSSRMSPKSR